MQIKGSHTIQTDAEHLWKLLNDPETLALILPGCKELKAVGEDQYEGRVGAKVGAILSEYTTRITVTEKEFPTTYRLKIEGQGPGGMVNGYMHINLEPVADVETVVHYSGEANVAGRLARVGQRLVDAAAKMMAKRGFKALGRVAEEKRIPRE